MIRTLFLLITALLLSVATDIQASTPSLDLARTRQKANEARAYIRQKGFNKKYCILIDMSLPSGVKRFVVWDFNKSTILLSGLVSHGCGRMPWSATWSKDKPEFSNADGSHCTALGRYRIDGRAYSNWGIHVKYFLAGLDKTNSNALGRQIVFHSWESVPESDVYPEGTPEGWGCPAISNTMMKAVDKLLQKQKRMLMWIYV